jgi:AraC-like DNA-binding protein/quercetin dioxygenase-like cupin family protein
MKLEYEIIHPDEGSSFKLEHRKLKAEDFQPQQHFHPEYEIDCIVSGSGECQIANQLNHYQNGDCILIGPNLPHSGVGINAEGIHDIITVHISEVVIKQSILSRPEMKAINSVQENAKYGMKFKSATKDILFKKLNRLLKLSPFEKFIELLSIFQLIATTAEYELIIPSISFSSTLLKKNERLQKIFKYIEEHYQEEMDIREVANIANLSVPSFCNYFKKITHSTFTDFVNQYRIQQACILLQQDKTIAEASFECGFNNVVYFNKVFKNILHKTPSAFKIEKLLH